MGVRGIKPVEREMFEMDRAMAQFRIEARKRFKTPEGKREAIESALETALRRSTDFFYPDKAAAAAQVVESLTRALRALDQEESS